MKWWTVVRVAGPVSVGLGFVLLRPTWVSVAVLGLLICVAVWLDGQERRADDVEALEEHVNERVSNVVDRIKALEADASHNSEVLARASAKVSEMGARLDATAQQRKGPSL